MKKTLKATLLSLSVASIAACGPSAKPSVSLTDVAQAAARQDDRVSAHELATWLIEGRGDFKLVDVRMPADFEKGSIDKAEKNHRVFERFRECGESHRDVATFGY